LHSKRFLVVRRADLGLVVHEPLRPRRLGEVVNGILLDVDGLASRFQLSLVSYGVELLPEVGDSVAELEPSHMIHAELDAHVVANVLTQRFLPHVSTHPVPQKDRVASADHRANVAAESHA
jgi:hypothetical protein